MMINGSVLGGVVGLSGVYLIQGSTLRVNATCHCRSRRPGPRHLHHIDLGHDPAAGRQRRQHPRRRLHRRDVTAVFHRRVGQGDRHHDL
jgi:hypothetical protein